jgi:hypothetical protein
MDTYYFMFSEGSYSDYCVGGLYTCDHPVTVDEWDAFCNAVSAERHKRGEEVFAPWKGQLPRDYMKDDDYKAVSAAYWDWWRESDPQKRFVEKHNMQRVEYTELWGRD